MAGSTIVDGTAPGDGEPHRLATLVDTHAHLQWPALAADIEVVMGRARAAGVVRVLTLATDVASLASVIDLAARFDGVYAAVGIHPGDVARDGGPDAIMAALERVAVLLDRPRVVAVGETGLDYYHQDNPPRAAQIASFRGHLQLAERTGKPICVHNREATDDVMDMLEEYAGRVTPVLHCYTGDLATAQRAQEIGCYLSFAGNSTYPKLHALLEVAAEVQDDRLLIETDAPFLAPQPRRGRRNEPAHIVYTYDAVASARGTTRARLASLVSTNAAALFGWPHQDEDKSAA